MSGPHAPVHPCPEHPGAGTVASAILMPMIGALALLTVGACNGRVVACFDSSPEDNFCERVLLPPPEDPPPEEETRAVASLAVDAAPAGLYSIDEVVDRPFVDGVSLRVSWAEMEPQPGAYDFSRIEAGVRAAQALGQHVTIATDTADAPAWLLAADATRSLPWDAFTLARLERLIEAQAAFTIDGVMLAAHPVVAQVQAAIGGTGGVDTRPLPPGYSQDVWETSVLQSLHWWARAYPRKHLYVALHAGAGDDSLRTRLLQTFDGVRTPRMHVLQDRLTAQAPSLGDDDALALSAYAVHTTVLLRACGAFVQAPVADARCRWPAPALNLPDSAFAHAVQHYGARYFEFHPADLGHDAFYSQFEYWSRVIKRPVGADADA